jgi:hypothetical protein
VTEREDFEFAALRQAVNYRQAVFNEFSPFLAGNVIEVGAGVGQMTELVHRRTAISRLVCVEPDARFCAEHRKLFGEIELVPGTIEDVPAQTIWDAIVSTNVLEHISDDEGELSRYGALLKRGKGKLCLLVPARPEIYGSIDRRFGHYRRYTRGELRTKLLATGFRIDKLTYFNFPGYFAWWLNFCVLKRRKFNPSQVQFFDSFIFPLLNWCETRLFRPPIGQSLIAVAVAQ